MTKTSSSPHVIMALDFGGSGLKGVYTQTNEDNSQTLFMESHITAASVQSLQEKTSGQSAKTDPENIAWVAFEGVAYAVGYLATTRYLSNQGLSKKKYTLAVYRTLAAIWVVKQKLKLKDNFKLTLGVVLPPGEFRDAGELFNLINIACLTGFDTPTGRIKVKLVKFNCMPEGAGIWTLHKIKNRNLIRQNTTAILMLGYRNASLLMSYRGVLDSGRTTNLGMVRLIELVQQKTSGLTNEALLKAISEAGSDLTPAKFLTLTERDAPLSVYQAEIKKIIEAVKQSRSEYLIALKSWLGEVLPKSDYAIVLCGGTADYFKEDLCSCFPGISLNWHGDFVILATWQHKWLGNRLGDVYGVLRILIAQAKTETKKVG